MVEIIIYRGTEGYDPRFLDLLERKGISIDDLKQKDLDELVNVFIDIANSAAFAIADNKVYYTNIAQLLEDISPTPDFYQEVKKKALEEHEKDPLHRKALRYFIGL